MAAGKSYAPLPTRSHLQSLSAVQTAQAFMVHLEAFAFEQNPYSPPSKARAILRDATQPIADVVISRPLAWLVSHRWTRTSCEPTRLPLAHPLGFERPHRFFSR